MDIGHVDQSFNKHQQLKHQQSKHGVAESSFKSTLMSQASLIAGAVSAADQVHQQSLLKAQKTKPVSYLDNQNAEDESVMATIQDIKKRLKKIRAIERLFLGI